MFDIKDVTKHVMHKPSYPLSMLSVDQALGAQVVIHCFHIPSAEVLYSPNWQQGLQNSFLCQTTYALNFSITEVMRLLYGGELPG